MDEQRSALVAVQVLAALAWKTVFNLYEASFDSRWLGKAFPLNVSMVDLFWDETDGRFFSNLSAEVGAVYVKV